MSRSATVQFNLYTEEEARAFLARCPKTADTHGDRLVMQRVIEQAESRRRELAAAEPVTHG